MNTRTAREYTMSEPAQFLRNWREQRPSNYSGIDRVSRWWLGESVVTRGEPAYDFIFVS
jgi:hypothetical protein